MDKYEYKVRSEEIKNLIAEGQFARAAEIADTIDWRRVKSVMMLCTIGDLYKINRRYEDAKNMLLLAYDRRPGGRTICYSLCELCIKTEEFVQAVNYYKEFSLAAPKDSGRYILQYKLYEAQDVSIEERIGVLEELKKRDYREKWAYELAYLYHKVGLAARCVEECDELILWFGEGRYVIKAMELKMLHEPLSPIQQEKYDHRFDKMEEIPEQEENGARHQEGQWAAHGRFRGDGRQGAAGRQQGNGRWESDGTYQENEQWENDGQSQEGRQWEADSQYQENGSWEADSQYQGNGLWEADDQHQGNGSWEADDQYQGSGLWEADGQYPGNEQWESENQPQENGVWGSEGQVEGNGQWGDYSQSVDGGASSAVRWESASHESEAAVGTEPEEMEIQVKTVDVSEYNTINLQAELAAGLQEVLGEDDTRQASVLSMPVPKAEEKSRENASKIQEQEASTEVSNKEQTVSEKEGRGKGNAAAVSQIREESEPTEKGMVRKETVPVTEAYGQEKTVSQTSVYGSAESAKAGERPDREALPSGAKSLPYQESAAVGNILNEDGDTAPREQSSNDECAGKSTDAYEDTLMEYAAEEEQVSYVRDDTAEIVLAQMRMESVVRAKEQVSSIDKIRKEPSKPPMEGLSQEEDGISTTEPESAVIEKQITGQMQLEDILAEWERTKKENEEKYKEEIRQQALRQTGPMFAEFEEAVRDGLLERLEKGEVIDIDAAAQKELGTDGRENGQAEYFEDTFGETQAEDAERPEREEGRERRGSRRRPESRKKEEEQEQPESRRQPEGLERPESLKKAEEQEQKESPRQPEGQEQPESLKKAEEQEKPEFRKQTEGQEVSGKQNQAKGKGLAEGRTPLDKQKQTKTDDNNGSEEERKEKSGGLKESAVENVQEKEETEGAQELPAPNEEISLTEASENALTGRAEEPPIEREAAKIRRLTREEKELYAPFIQSRSARERLVQAIDNISMAAYTGNIVITGEEGMDTMTFAKNMIREVQMTDSNFSGKVAKVSGKNLNQRNVEETLWNLNNGALIIYHASGMNPQTAAMLHRSLQQENLGIIVVLEDTKKAIQKMFLGTPELFGDFTARMDLEALSNDTLVSFGRRYAREMEYSIDELGVLALHTRIEELQTIDHVVTVVEVKKIVDGAIRHACRKTLGHFFDILFAKRYDEEDMIILTEKDFA